MVLGPLAVNTPAWSASRERLPPWVKAPVTVSAEPLVTVRLSRLRRLCTQSVPAPWVTVTPPASMTTSASGPGTAPPLQLLPTSQLPLSGLIQ